MFYVKPHYMDKMLLILLNIVHWSGTGGETWWLRYRRLRIHGVTNTETSETRSVTSVAGPCTPPPQSAVPALRTLFQ
jgi:hypothetical protein